MEDTNNMPVESGAEHPIAESTPAPESAPEVSAETKGPTPTVNRAGANQQTINIELIDGRKLDAVRWYNVELEKDEVQVDIDGVIYDAVMQDDGKYNLL